MPCTRKQQDNPEGFELAWPLDLEYDALPLGKHIMYKLVQLEVNEPPRGKTNNVVSEQVRHKPACTSTEKS